VLRPELRTPGGSDRWSFHTRQAPIRGDRSKIIWTDADIAHIKQTADLAAHTGLRLGDLLRLSWSHVGADAITLTGAHDIGLRRAVENCRGAR
jgi:integrase